MSRERFVVDLNDGKLERKSPEDFERDRAVERLEGMAENEVLQVDDPDGGIGNARLMLDKEAGVFRELLTPSDRLLRKSARQFPFDAIVSWYVAHRRTARFSYIEGARRRIEVSVGKDAGEARFPQAEKMSPARPVEDRRAPADEGARKPEVVSPEMKGRAAVNRLRALYSGERVSVWNPESQKLIYLEKSSFGKENSFTLVSPERPDFERRFARVLEFQIFTAEQVEAMVTANPDVVVFEESPAIRERAREKAEAKKRLPRLKARDGVVIGELLYLKGPDGSFGLTRLGVQQRETGTRMLGKARLTEADVLQLLENASIYDGVRFVEAGEQRRGTFSETDAELQAVHGRFAKLLPALYPDVAKRGLLTKIGFGSGQTERDKVLEHYRSGGDIEQGRIGFCFALGAAFALKRTHPEMYFDMLARTVRREGDAWQVRFLGYERLSEQQKLQFNRSYPDGWITVTDSEVAEWKRGVNIGDKTKSASKADEADIILERAYLSYRSYFQAGENTGQTFIANAKGDLDAEGGSGNRALFDMLGPLVEKWKISPYNADTAYTSLDANGYADEARGFFEGEYTQNSEDYVVTVGSPAYRRDEKDLVKYIDYTEPSTGRKMRLPKKHAYALLKVRAVSGGDVELRIADPHDTKQKQFWMPLRDFTKVYSDVSYVKLVADFRRTDPQAARVLKESYG